MLLDRKNLDSRSHHLNHINSEILHKVIIYAQIFSSKKIGNFLYLEDCENMKSNNLDTFLEDENTSLSSDIVLKCPQLKYIVYTIFEENHHFTKVVYPIKYSSASSFSSSSKA